MKRIALGVGLIFLAGILGRLPSSGSDVAKLQPVEVIYIYSTLGTYHMETDTGDHGRGKTVQEAFADLQKTSRGEIFLETAEHFLVAPQLANSLDSFIPYLRPGCSVTIATGKPDMEQVAQFLSTHKPECTLNDVRAGENRIPILITGEERMELVQP